MKKLLIPILLLITQYSFSQVVPQKITVRNSGTKIDSSIYSTKANVNNVADSVLSLVPKQFNPIAGTGATLSGTYPNITFNTSGGTVSLFSKVDNWGIASSVATATTTPVHTVGIDSATVSGYYVRRKDSTIAFVTPTQLAAKRDSSYHDTTNLGPMMHVVGTGSSKTMYVDTASSTKDGILLQGDWNTFNNKQGSITLTTTGTGAATFIGNALNIPTPSGGTTPTLDAVSAVGSTTSRDLTIHGITIGTGAGNSNTNVALGYVALQDNTTGTNSVALGRGALNNNTTGGDNVAIGFNSLLYNLVGYHNVGIGSSSFGAATGNANTGVGYYSGQYTTTGNNEVAFGAQALQYNTTGSNITAVGLSAMRFNSTNNGGTAIGSGASQYSQADNNTAVGYAANSTFIANSSGAKTFAASAITGTKIYVPGHGFGTTGTSTLLLYTQGTSTITGLSNGVVYPATIVSADTVSISSVVAGGSATGAIFTPQYNYTNITTVGYNSVPTASNQVTLGNTNTTQVQTTGTIVGAGIRLAYLAKSTNYTATLLDHTIDCTGTTTITLPTAVGIPGKEYIISNSGAGTITINTTSAQKFTNVTSTPTSLTMTTLGAYIVVSTGAAWVAK